MKIKGKPYIIFVDEGGSGGLTSAAQLQAACAAGLPPFPMARIIDISDETNPKIVSRLMLEMHDPANCDQSRRTSSGSRRSPTAATTAASTISDHATTLACGYFNSGIRVFDIRDPQRPKEIAYYNPAGVTTPVRRLESRSRRGLDSGGPRLVLGAGASRRETGTLWTTCQDNGLLMLKFTNGAWPLPGSNTPPGKQN